MHKLSSKPILINLIKIGIKSIMQWVYLCFAIAYVITKILYDVLNDITFNEHSES